MIKNLTHNHHLLFYLLFSHARPTKSLVINNIRSINNNKNIN